ncbi:hypothetical protein SASPL_103108 [Salvia splendens]|uniref:Uncharacterized protein n=1 Tax=Salvia splendens TaxID=180675 RepID=A0A8X8YT60_SALSN|nr:hypothetical protein SASPL_103108 [Salvia splendens]
MYSPLILGYTVERLNSRLKLFQNLGISSEENANIVFSNQKMKEVIEFLLATGKYHTSSIVASPSALVWSIEKRLEPRMQILMLLESWYLIKKWPCLAVVTTLTNARFFNRFVRPCYDVIGDEHITKLFVEGIKK